jgi:hypothetical protein
MFSWVVVGSLRVLLSVVVRLGGGDAEFGGEDWKAISIVIFGLCFCGEGAW